MATATAERTWRAYPTRPLPRTKRARPRRWYRAGLCSEPGGVVYFIDCGEFTKIGHTLGLICNRLTGIETHNPYPIRLWALVPAPDQQIERDFHDLLAPHQHRGEWFRLSAAMRALVSMRVKAMHGELYLDDAGDAT